MPPPQPIQANVVLPLPEATLTAHRTRLSAALTSLRDSPAETSVHMAHLIEWKRNEDKLLRQHERECRDEHEERLGPCCLGTCWEPVEHAEEMVRVREMQLRWLKEGNRELRSMVEELTELVERAQIAAIDLMFAELSVGDES